MRRNEESAYIRANGIVIKTGRRLGKLSTEVGVTVGVADLQTTRLNPRAPHTGTEDFARNTQTEDSFYTCDFPGGRDRGVIFGGTSVCVALSTDIERGYRVSDGP